MLGDIVAHLADMGLENVVSIEEGHLSVGLDPDLVSSMCGKQGKGSDMKSELAGLGELAQTGAHRVQLCSRHTGGIFGNLLLHVVDSVLLESEDVGVFVVDEVRDVSADVVGELLKHGFRFFFGQRSHCVVCVSRADADGWKIFSLAENAEKKYFTAALSKRAGEDGLQGCCERVCIQGFCVVTMEQIWS